MTQVKADPRLAEFFQRHDGRRLDIADSQPIERGMATADLYRELGRYEVMLMTGERAHGTRITERERVEIASQADRFRAELKRRQG